MSLSHPSHVRVYSRLSALRGLVTRFPVFFGFVAGTTFFFISSTCLAALLLPMVYWAGRLEPDGRPPVRSDFSPKRESKSPGPPKPRSRVRYEDGEKQLRRQRQYTTGGVGSSRSRSSKSSRRSLVGPSCISTDETRFTSSLVYQRGSAAGWGTCRLWKYITSEERFTEVVRTGLGRRVNRLAIGFPLHTFENFVLVMFLVTVGA